MTFSSYADPFNHAAYFIRQGKKSAWLVLAMQTRAIYKRFITDNGGISAMMDYGARGKLTSPAGHWVMPLAGRCTLYATLRSTSEYSLIVK